MNCKYCGRQLNGENYCPGCGSPVTVEPTQQYPNQPNYNQQYPNQQNYNQQYNQQNNPNGTPSGLPKDQNAVTGFVCGLIGFFCCSIAGIPGLIFSILSQQDVKAGKVDPSNKTLGLVGMILSIISLAYWVINIIGTAASGSTSLGGIIDLIGLFS